MTDAACRLYRPDARSRDTRCARAPQCVGGDGYELMQRAGAGGLGTAAAALAAGAAHRGGLRAGQQWRRWLRAGAPGAAAAGLRRACSWPRTAPARARPQRAAPAYWRAAGGTRRDLRRPRCREVDVVVDALFGIGLTRAPDDAVAGDDRAHQRAAGAGAGARRAHRPGCRHAARAPGAAVRADVHAAVHRAPSAACTPARRATMPARSLVDDLDLPTALFDGIAADALAVSRRERWRAGLRAAASRMRTRANTATCCASAATTAWAARCACAPKRRCAAAPAWPASRRAPSGVPALLAARPEAMTHAVEDAGALQPLLARADVLAIGPGLGQGDWGRALFAAALRLAASRWCSMPMRLNLLAAHPRRLPQAILTPHPGEAARLLGMRQRRASRRDRFAAARALARTLPLRRRAQGRRHARRGARRDPAR